MKIVKSIILVLSILVLLNFASAIVEDDCTIDKYYPVSGIDTTENGIPYILTETELSYLEESDDEKYLIAGSWPHGSYDNSYFLLFNDFNVTLPECIDLQYAHLNLEWTRIGCMNVREAKVLIKIESNWIEVWSGQHPDLPTSDQLFNIEITSYISSKEDLENLQVKFLAWTSVYGYTTHNLVELEIYYCDCLTHNICNYQQQICEEVYGEGENECNSFLSDCAECIEDSHCAYLNEEYCGGCTGDVRMQAQGVCIDFECTTQTSVIEDCNIYDTWIYGEWNIFDCYKSRDNEYRDYSCFEDNDETYCDFEITQEETETQNINEGMVCNLGCQTCKDSCTIGQEQYTCQSGTCEFDIWTNLFSTNPFLCINGQQSDQCSMNCGAECEQDSDCLCEGVDGCVGQHYYEYPEYGICKDDCTCNIDDTECTGPCKPTIYYNDPRCNQCINETPENLPESTVCAQWFFNYITGCHEVIYDDGTSVCDTSSTSEYTCINGDVYRTYETITTYCGEQTGQCNGEQTIASEISLFNKCGHEEYCVEGKAYCQSGTAPSTEKTISKPSRTFGRTPSLGPSIFNIVCGDGYCVLPYELQEGKYYCPSDCGLVW